MMPGLDGVEICKRLKDHAEIARIPVILLTAKTDPGSRLRGLESGGDIYMTKPFKMAELGAQINALLARTQCADTSSVEPPVTI